MESKQAQAITEAMMEVLNDSMENVSGSYVSKSEMQKVSLCFHFCGLVLFCFVFEGEGREFVVLTFVVFSVLCRVRCFRKTIFPCSKPKSRALRYS